MNSNPHTLRPPIAIVGVSALFPGSADATGFWRDILAGTDRMTPVPPTHWLIDDYFDPDPVGAGQDLRPARRLPRSGGPRPDGVRRAAEPGPVHRHVPAARAHRRPAGARRRRPRPVLRAGPVARLGHPRRHLRSGAARRDGQPAEPPLWLQGMRRAGVPEDVAVAACAQIADLHPTGPRAPSPGCSATWSPAGSPTASISAARTASPTRPAHPRSRRSPWASTSCTSATATS